MRLLVPSGKSEPSRPEALAERPDAAAHGSATRAEAAAREAALRGASAGIARLRPEPRRGALMLSRQIAARTDKPLVRLGGPMLALTGTPSAALRLT